MGARVDLTGRVFGKLTILRERSHRDKWGSVVWECKCLCGNTSEVSTGRLTSGNTRSCGCQRAISRISHGFSKHPLYKRWANMNDRCYNPKSTHYEDYGGRGLTVFHGWRDDPTEFIRWGEANGYQPRLQLDRIDNDGNYSPDNCHFVTAMVNSKNKRIPKNNTTGLLGVGYRLSSSNYWWQFKHYGKTYTKSGFKTAQQASDARDEYIIANGFPHKLNTPSITKELP